MYCSSYGPDKQLIIKALSGGGGIIHMEALRTFLARPVWKPTKYMMPKLLKKKVIMLGYG
ncbi:hypothetical protein ES708_21535 [subsurface metagenome]